MQSAVQKDQLAVAACVRLQLQICRGYNTNCTVRSNEQPLNGATVPCDNQILFPQTAMREEQLYADRQFVTFLSE